MLGNGALNCFNGCRPQTTDRQKREVGRGGGWLCSAWHSTRWEDSGGRAQLAPFLLLLLFFYRYTHIWELWTSCSQRPKHTITNQSHQISTGTEVRSSLNLISKSPWSQWREAPLEGNSEQESDSKGSINLHDYSPFAKSQWDQFLAEQRRLVLAKEQPQYQ